MWQQTLSKVLFNSGWGSGFRLPIANAENLELERQLEKRHRLIQQRHAEIDDIRKHTEILEKGLKSASDHIAHDAKLTNAKNSEIAAEKELLKLAEKDGYKLTHECKIVQESFKKAVQRNRALVDELEVRRRDLAELTELIEYDRQELAIIEKKATDESQIMSAIEEICSQDADALKKYETRYRKATAETSKLRTDLDEKVSTTRVMQAELDGLGDRFRKLHKERGQVVILWKDTMVALSQRDKEMNDIAEEYQHVDSDLKSESQKVEEERKKLASRQQSSGNASLQLNKWDRKVMDLREEIRSVSEFGSSLKDNLFSYETSISVASTQIQDITQRSSQIDKELAEMNERVANTSAMISELRVKAEESSNSILSAADRMKQIQALIEEEEKKLELLLKNSEREMKRKGLWLNKKKHLESNVTGLENEMRGAQTQLAILGSRCKDAEITASFSNSEIRWLCIILCNPLHNSWIKGNQQFIG